MTSEFTVERRRAPRHDTSLDGVLNSSCGSRRPVAVVDLSGEGFNAHVGSQPIGGSDGFSVKFGGLEQLGAELRWASGANAGFRFERPLHPAVLDHVVRSNPPELVED